MPNQGTEINWKVFSCVCNPRAATCNTWVNLICKFLFLYVSYIRDWGQWSSCFRPFTCSLRLGRLSLYHFIVLSCWRQMYEDNRHIIKFTFRFNAITVWTHKPRRGWCESMLSPKSLFFLALKSSCYWCSRISQHHFVPYRHLWSHPASPCTAHPTSHISVPSFFCLRDCAKQK